MSPADLFHGPVSIGTIFNVMLYGIMITQMYFYYTTYKRDPIWMKLFVLAIFVVDTLNTLFDVMFIYISVIKHFDDVEYLKKPNWCFGADPATTGIVEMMVQAFFAWRIYVLTGSRTMVACIISLAFAGAVCAMIVTSQNFVVPSFARFGDFKGYVIGWLASAVVADVIITSVLVTYLVRPAIHQSNAQLTMSTGLLTSVVAAADLTAYLINPSGIDLMLNILLCKLYSNSLMSSLNSRHGWRHNEAPASVITGNQALSEGIAFSFPREGRRSLSMDSKTGVPQRPPGAKAFPLFDRGRLLGTTAVKSGPEIFVHVESHEVRDACTTSISPTDFPSADVHGGDIHPGFDAVALPLGGGVRKPVNQSLSSQV